MAARAPNDGEFEGVEAEGGGGGGRAVVVVVVDAEAAAEIDEDWPLVEEEEEEETVDALAALDFLSRLSDDSKSSM